MTALKPNRIIRICVVFLLVLILGSAFAGWLAPQPYDRVELSDRLEGPSSKHWLGTDELGRDIWSRMLYGGRVSLLVSLVVVGLSSVIGAGLGSISGYAGGWTDEGIMRVGDLLLAFPGILLAIGLMAVLGPGLGNVVLALAIIGWVSFARLSRSLTLKIRELEFVQASRNLGASTPRILLRHVLPNVLPALSVQLSFSFAGMILAESALSFLGLGVQPPQPSWGNMLSEGKNHLLDAPHLTVFPGMAIFLSVLAFNLLGDALRDQLDPRLKSIL
ncbi:MAG TPA: ABC transporter permease [Acidobacteriota bacterium]|nr:ABC transporter permease [Acidobacteriota bacterium]